MKNLNLKLVYLFIYFLLFFFLYPIRNYGGVYVGLPADLTTVASSQSKSTRKGKRGTTTRPMTLENPLVKKMESGPTAVLLPCGYIKTLFVTLVVKSLREEKCLCQAKSVSLLFGGRMPLSNILSFICLYINI